MESLFPVALRHINTAIPAEVLRKVFGTQEVNPFYAFDIPLDTHIEREVIMGQVVKDIQLFDSTETVISLTGIPNIPVSDTHSSLVIPPERRGGRDIMSVRGISFNNTVNVVGGSTKMGIGSNVDLAAASMLGSYDHNVPTGTHECILIAPNTILVVNRWHTLNHALLHVNLSVDDRLTHIKNATSLDFAELCIWACKNYCYNKLIIAMGSNVIEYGRELGVFGDVVREWRDARLTYLDLLKRFRTTVALIDPNRRRRMIRNRMPKLLG